MELKELLEFISIEDKRLIEYYPPDKIDKEAFARSIKLIEEIGELFNELLKISNLQRLEKTETRKNLEEEFADVVITTLLLAKRLNIDIEKALKKKIKGINNRYEKI